MLIREGTQLLGHLLELASGRDERIVVASPSGNPGVGEGVLGLLEQITEIGAEHLAAVIGRLDGAERGGRPRC